MTTSNLLSSSDPLKKTDISRSSKKSHKANSFRSAPVTSTNQITNSCFHHEQLSITIIMDASSKKKFLNIFVDNLIKRQTDTISCAGILLLNAVPFSDRRQRTFEDPINIDFFFFLCHFCRYSSKPSASILDVPFSIPTEITEISYIQEIK